jgi:acyl-CoA thioesterase FadM
VLTSLSWNQANGTLTNHETSQISLEKILALEPAGLRMAVPEAYRDENGHMNVRWYAAIFDEAGDTLHARLGLTPEFHKAYGTGTMDLENHFNYLNEVGASDRLAIFSRLVAHSAKRLHYLMFMVDETKGAPGRMPQNMQWKPQQRRCATCGSRK